MASDTPERLRTEEKHATVRPGIAERILINAKQMSKWAVRRKLIAIKKLSGSQVNYRASQIRDS